MQFETATLTYKDLCARWTNCLLSSTRSTEYTYYFDYIIQADFVGWKRIFRWIWDAIRSWRCRFQIKRRKELVAWHISKHFRFPIIAGACIILTRVAISLLLIVAYLDSACASVVTFHGYFHRLQIKMTVFIGSNLPVLYAGYLANPNSSPHLPNAKGRYRQSVVRPMWMSRVHLSKHGSPRRHQDFQS